MEDFDIDHSEDFDDIDHSIEPENSRDWGIFQAK